MPEVHRCWGDCPEFYAPNLCPDYPKPAPNLRGGHPKPASLSKSGLFVGTPVVRGPFRSDRGAFRSSAALVCAVRSAAGAKLRSGVSKERVRVGGEPHRLGRNGHGPHRLGRKVGQRVHKGVGLGDNERCKKVSRYLFFKLRRRGERVSCKRNILVHSVHICRGGRTAFFRGGRTARQSKPRVVLTQHGASQIAEQSVLNTPVYLQYKCGCS